VLLLLLLLLVAYPFVVALYFSMSNAFIGRPSEFIGFRNFVKLWESDAFRQTFQNAFVFTGIAVVFKVVMGIILALLLNEQLWFKRMIRGAVLLPWVIPTALSTLGWWWIEVEKASPASRSSQMSESAARNAPEPDALCRSLMASVIGTPTLRKVESWRENRMRSAVLTRKKVGSSR